MVLTQKIIPQTSPQKRHYLPWVMALIAALFFLYEFIQMNMFNSLALSFEKTFSLSAFQIGLVSAFYFLSDSILLYPAGVLLDRYSSRKLILFGMLLCIVGTLLVTLSNNAWFLVISRFLSGTASAFCLLSILRLSASWFPAYKMGRVTGIIVTLGMLGGAISQTPLVLLINTFGWRWALFSVALLGLVFFIPMFFLLKDAPEDLSHAVLKTDKFNYLSCFHGFGTLLLHKNNWLTGVYICTMNLPIMLLAGLFGTQWMVEAHSFSMVQGANISMMIFIGTIIGSTFFGFLSDLIHSRKKTMLIAALLSLINFIWLLYIPSHSYLLTLLLTFFLGFFTAAQIIGYPVVRETNDPENIGAALGFVSVIIMGMPFLLQPIVGLLMNTSARLHHRFLLGHYIYQNIDYKIALSLLSIGFLLSIGCALALPETHPYKNKNI